MFVMPIQSTKQCRGCWRALSFDAFGPDPNTRDGLKRKCRKCATEASRDSRLKGKYGITLEQHQQMYMDQRMCCALCGDQIAYERVHTDHDHKTGKVRGLLCQKCNLGLGHFGDTIEGLQRAIEYLKTGVGR